MASSESSAQAGVNGTGDKQQLTAAQKLKLKHEEGHKATIEEVPDEEDLRHTPEPISSSVLESTEEPAPSGKWPATATMSAKAAGKQKEQAPAKAPVLDMESTKSFPGLGGTVPVPPAQLKPRTWVTASSPAAPKATNEGANGKSTNGSSTPKSGVNTPPSTTSYPILQGQANPVAANQQPPILKLRKDQVLPRNQLKKPLAEILKDINKKYRTNLTISTGEGGILEFKEAYLGAPPKDSTRNQALKDLGTQIGAKVGASIQLGRILTDKL